LHATAKVHPALTALGNRYVYVGRRGSTPRTRIIRYLSSFFLLFSLPTLDKRDKNAQAKRIARDLDRGPLPPPLPPVGSLPWAEYGKIPFEMRQSREKAEKRARERSWNVRSQMARANLLNYVEPVILFSL
jgi:hypothetical protein